jgi:hypothetical protein
VTIVKFTNGADANNPNAAGVPNVAGGGVVTWTYRVTNTGNTSVPMANVAVTDSTTGVAPTFTSVLTGDVDTVFEPGEVWLYTATGSALNLLLPPPVGVTTVANSCTADGTQSPRTAYTNVGTVTIPGATDDDPSSYCNPPPADPVPGLKIEKTVDKSTIEPYEMVTYTYVVTNTGNTTLDNIVVTDDNGTPATLSDDFTVGTIATLAPGASATLTAQVIPVVTTTSVVNGNPVTAGAVIVVVLQANGDYQVTYLQDFGINDNTYGTGAIGWPSGHTFGNLTGSDKLEFRFFDKLGNVVLDFYVDTISSAASLTRPDTGQVISYPAGYGTLGPFGGDGSMITGNSSNIVSFSTSITENLNNPLNLPNKAALIVNSPTSLVGTDVVVDPVKAPGGWNHINNYSVVIKGSAFTAGGGFGGVVVPDQHNSPNKLGGPNGMSTVAKDSTVVNTANAVTASGSGLTATATASVDILVPPESCSLAMTATKLDKNAFSITIANNGPTDVVLSAFALTWPSANGKLTQINLDGDVVYTTPDILAPSADLDATELAAASTAAKRTIAKGTSDVLKMTFQSNVNKTLSNYTGSFTFGGCTLTLP